MDARPKPSLTPRAPRPPKLTREVSVMAWIEDACGQVLMVQQTAGKRLWTLPGGKAKSGETLDLALRRELLEEIGERVRGAHPIAIFDRPEKQNLTVLFRVRLFRQRLRLQKQTEIENISFKASLPKNASPSASYFWKHRDRIVTL